jgi:hypothetical protein
MALIPVDNVGQYGIVKEQNPWQLPPNVWSDGGNVKTDEGSIKKALGYSSVMETVPVAPYFIISLISGNVEFWIIGGLSAIHVYDNTSNSDTLDGLISNSATTITVDSTTGFENNGTITIGDEQITYTNTSATQFTGCTRGAKSTTAAEHADGAVVTRTKKWYDITRGAGAGGAYSTTSSENWTGTVIGGVLVMTNGVDVPQYWELISGVPATVQKMQNLNNWTSTIECKSMRSFRSFLVALNVTKSDVNYPGLVKWSTEAGLQTTPTSWDETSAIVDAGEYELADSKGDILDGLPLADTFMIYKEDSTYTMTYVGTPFIFSFRQLSPTIGALAKNCVVAYPKGHAIFGNGDFYINDGRTLQPILPPKLRSYVFSTIDGEALKKSFVVADYGRSEILFCFVVDGGLTISCDKAIVWNYNTNTFTIRDLPDLGHMGYGNITDPNVMTSWGAMATTLSAAITSTSSEDDISVDSTDGFQSSGYATIDSEQINYTAVTGTSLTGVTRAQNSTTGATHAINADVYNGPTWNTVSGPWTSTYAKVENVLMFASPENTEIYRDNSGNKEDTTDMISFVERTGLSITANGQPDQGIVKRITGIYPKMSIDGTDTINVYLATQMSTDEAVTWSSAVSFNPDSQSKVSVMGTGKFYGVKFQSTTDMNWKLDGYSLEVQDAGRRGGRSY